MWTLISFSPRGAVVEVDYFDGYLEAVSEMCNLSLQDRVRANGATTWRLYSPHTRLPVKL